MRLWTFLPYIALILSACDKGSVTPTYSLPTGAIDPRPVSIWAPPYMHMPPEPDGSPYDPRDGMSVQEFADQLIGKHIADFVAHRSDFHPSGGPFSVFFPKPGVGPGPGMCSVRRFFIYQDYSDGQAVKASDGEWLSKAYSVVGSLAPLGKASPQNYAHRLQVACESRTDLGMWFSTERPEDAYLGAQLADLAIAASRKKAPLPFALACEPFPRDVQGIPRCAADVRKSVSSMIPRSIIDVNQCEGSGSQRCLSIDLAKSPGNEATLDQTEDRWTLVVRFRNGHQPLIKSVQVSDTYLIIE